MEDITAQESGGNYRAKGPLTKYGRAWGRYQVLDQNIGPWTKKCLGRAFSLDEWLDDPEAQDLTVGCIMDFHWDIWGNRNDVIAVHFTGHPAKNNNRCDVNMCLDRYLELANAD